MKRITKTNPTITWFYTYFKYCYFPIKDLGNYESPGILKGTIDIMELLHGFPGVKKQVR